MQKTSDTCSAADLIANIVNIAADLGGMAERHGAFDWHQFALLDCRV
jgi:hypothetical protein